MKEGRSVTLTVLTLPPLWIHAMRISPSLFRFRSSMTGGGAGGAGGGALRPVPLTLLVTFGTEDEPVLKGSKACAVSNKRARLWGLIRTGSRRLGR